MSLRPVASLLLLVLAFLATTTHFCGAVAMRQNGLGASRGTCHHQGMAMAEAAMPRDAARPAGEPVSAARRRGCCDPGESQSTPCEKICQSLAILRRPAGLPEPEGSVQMAPPGVVRSAALVVAGIDHIPLT